jgi:hypothetical protein
MSEYCFHAGTDGSVDALARLVARLHAARVEVTELHATVEAICVHLAGPQGLHRAMAVVQRNQDLSGTAAGCRCRPARRVGDLYRLTTYVTWTESVAEPAVADARGSAAQRHGSVDCDDVEVVARPDPAATCATAVAP